MAFCLYYIHCRRNIFKFSHILLYLHLATIVWLSFRWDANTNLLHESWTHYVPIDHPNHHSCMCWNVVCSQKM